MQQEELQEIIEYIPNEGEPVLISGPKPLHKPEKPSAQKEDYMMRSMDLDNAFMEERGKGVIEDNEVLVRGEWKQPQEATEEEEEEEEEEEPAESEAVKTALAEGEIKRQKKKAKSLEVKEHIKVDQVLSVKRPHV